MHRRYRDYGHRPDGRLSRRSALRAGAGGLAAALAAVRLRPAPAAAQDAAAAATPQAGIQPDLTGVMPLPLTGSRLAELEAYAAAKLAELGVPGASVSIIQGGEVVFARGYGVRELGRPEPVTADTLLRIGSVTKSFSSLLAASLVDAGRLAWETPLVDLLPGFAVADPALSPRLTVADAFCACTGLPRRDLELMFRTDDLSPERLVAAMGQLPLTAPFGEKFQYSNQMVAVGGFAAAVADGGSPDDLGHAYAIALRDRILNPIGMRRTTLALADAVAEGDYALPHAPALDGSPVPLPPLLDDTWIGPLAPSGALWSSAREMARYVQTELGRGVAPDGGRVVTAGNLERTWRPGVAMVSAPETPAIFAKESSNYALGWFAGTYGGQRLLSHTGGTYGFNALVTFLPDADLGLVVLTNLDGAGALLAYAVQFRLFEILFPQPATIDALLATVVSAQAAGRADLLSRLGEIDEAAVAPYLGRYDNPDLGAMTLGLRTGALVFETDGARSALRPRLDDAGATADYVFVDPPWASNPPARRVTLEAGSEGRPQVVVLTVRADPGEADLVYRYEPVGAATPVPDAG